MGVPEGGQTEHYYSLLTRNATFAALVAGAGGAAYAKTTIEGDTGLYRSFFGKVPDHLPEVVRGLGSKWEILSASQKRYPGTGQNTVATELLSSVIKEQKLTADQVAKVNVVLAFVEDSKERKKELARTGPFTSWNEAWSSLPFSLALVLSEGKVDPAKYYDQGTLADPRLAELMRRIAIRFEPGHDSIRYARLEILLTDGRKLVQDSDNFLFPFPESHWAEWLRTDGQQFLTARQLRTLEQQLRYLERVENVADLVQSSTPLLNPSGTGHSNKKE
jgi:2-methylcitrate dehydratase PrpD